jgi:hypothetical protein
MAGRFLAPSKRVLRKLTFMGSIEVGVGYLHRAGGLSEAFLKASQTPSCTRMRLAQTQVCPAFRYFDAIAPLTAISTSASSKR